MPRFQISAGGLPETAVCSRVRRGGVDFGYVWPVHDARTHAVCEVQRVQKGVGPRAIVLPHGSVKPLDRANDPVEVREILRDGERSRVLGSRERTIGVRLREMHE